MKKMAITKPELYCLVFGFLFITTLAFDVFVYRTEFVLAVIHGIIAGIAGNTLTLIYHIKIKK